MLVFLICSVSNAQLSGVVRDSTDASGVAYANIMVADGNSGTSAGEDGVFHLASASENTEIIVSAVGYKTIRTKVNNGSILMKRESYLLDEVNIAPAQGTLRFEMGDAEIENVSTWYGNVKDSPWKCALFYPADAQFSKTPFLEKISVATMSEVKKAIFLVHIYEVGEDGKPGKDLVDKNIIGQAKKGVRVTEVDLRPYRIKAPENGFFIGLECLAIDQNKQMRTLMSEKNKPLVAMYYPFFADHVSETQNAWIFTDANGWQKSQRHVITEEQKNYYREHLHEKNDKNYMSFYTRYEKIQDHFLENSIRLSLTN